MLIVIKKTNHSNLIERFRAKNVKSKNIGIVKTFFSFSSSLRIISNNRLDFYEFNFNIINNYTLKKLYIQTYNIVCVTLKWHVLFYYHFSRKIQSLSI